MGRISIPIESYSVRQGAGRPNTARLTFQGRLDPLLPMSTATIFFYETEEYDPPVGYVKQSEGGHVVEAFHCQSAFPICSDV